MYTINKSKKSQSKYMKSPISHWFRIEWLLYAVHGTDKRPCSQLSILNLLVLLLTWSVVGNNDLKLKRWQINEAMTSNKLYYIIIE